MTPHSNRNRLANDFMIVQISDDVINDVIDDEFLKYIHIVTNYSAFQRKLIVNDKYDILECL